jgi:hypothetical protein
MAITPPITISAVFMPPDTGERGTPFLQSSVKYFFLNQPGWETRRPARERPLPDDTGLHSFECPGGE